MNICPSCGHRGEAERCPNDGFPMVDEDHFHDDETEELLAGKVFGGRYRVDAIVGAGGMGRVYRATHLNMQQTVALKVMRKELSGQRTAVKRFFHEARACSKLQHHHTIKVHDFGVAEDGNAYLAMEFLKGRPLDAVLASSGALGTERAVHIAKQVCKSLEEAHEHGIVHRDLKPANIFLVDMAGERDYVKVLDFGLAKLVEGSETAESLTGSGMVVGTPAYMSPEQVNGDDLDGRSDIYALGVVLYQMLSRRLPFEGKKTTEMLVKRLTVDPTPLEQRLPAGRSVPGWLCELVHRMLARRVDDRPATVAEVRTCLELERADISEAGAAATREMIRAPVAETVDPLEETLPSPGLADQPVDRRERTTVPESDAQSSTSLELRGVGRSRRPMGLAVALAATVAVALLAAAYLALVPDDPDAPRASSALAEVQDAGSPSGEDRERSPRSQAMTAGAKAPDVSADTPPPAPTSDAAAPPRSREASTAGEDAQPSSALDEAAVPETVSLRIESEPVGAWVVVEPAGLKLGRTPIVMEWPAGKDLSLYLRKKGYERLRRSLRPDRSMTVVLTLKKARRKVRRKPAASKRPKAAPTTEREEEAPKAKEPPRQPPRPQEILFDD